MVTNIYDHFSSSNNSTNPITPSQVFSDCKKGYLSSTQEFLSGGGDVNIKDDQGRTLLHSAIQNGHLKIAQFLVTRGANIDALDRWDLTPLHIAVQQGQYETVQFLIQEKALVSFQDYNSQTPLHFAALLKPDVNSLKIIQLLQAAKDSLDLNGDTPLHLFIRSLKRIHKEGGKKAPTSEFFKALMTEANVKMKNKNGNTPLMQLIENSDIFEKNKLPKAFSILQLLKIEENLETGNKSGKPILHVLFTNASFLRKYQQTLERHHFYQLLYPSSVSLKASNGNNLLHEILSKNYSKASHSSLELVSKLLEINPDLKRSCNDEGNTPLHLALSIQFGSSDVANEFISKLYDQGIIRILNDQKNSLLHLAIMNPLLLQVTSTVKELISLFSFPKSLNVQNQDGKTPLHLALATISPSSTLDPAKVISKLVTEENKLLRDSQGNTPLHVALKNPSLMRDSKVASKIISSLLAPEILDWQNAEGDTPLHLLVQREFEMDEQLLDCISKLQTEKNKNMPNNHGNTPLHLAVMNPSLEKKNKELLLEILNQLSTSENKDMQNAIKDTPLSIVLRRRVLSGEKLFRILSFLITTKNIELEDMAGNTPLYLAACLWGNEDKITTAKLLLKYGANKSPENKKCTPLHLLLYSWNAPSPPSLETISCFFDEKFVDVQDQDLDTPLHLAVRSKELMESKEAVSILQKLISPKNLNMANKHGALPSHLGIFLNRSLLKFLITSENINMKDNGGRTLFHLAIENNRTPDTLYYLLTMGADINATNIKGRSPLHIAVMKGREDIALYLLTHPNILSNLQDKENQDTPLHRALLLDEKETFQSGGNPSIKYKLIRLLLSDKRIDLTLKNKDGNTVQDLMNEQNLIFINETKTLYRQTSQGLSPLTLNSVP